MANTYFDTLMQYGFEFYGDNLYSVGYDEVRVFGKGKSVVNVTIDNNYVYGLTETIQ